MSWSIGWDARWKRDIGYGVPAWCDHPGCKDEIDRGLAFVCGGEPYGGRRGCGLYFCARHLFYGGPRLPQLCERCCAPKRRKPFSPTSDHLDWIKHKLTDPSWKRWRDEYPELVALIEAKFDAPPH